MNTLDKWEAAFKVFSEDMNDLTGMREFSKRGLTLIDLVRTAKNMGQVLEEEFDNYEMSPRQRSVIDSISRDLIALTEDLK